MIFLNSLNIDLLNKNGNKWNKIILEIIKILFAKLKLSPIFSSSDEPGVAAVKKLTSSINK